MADWPPDTIYFNGARLPHEMYVSSRHFAGSTPYRLDAPPTPENKYQCIRCKGSGYEPGIGEGPESEVKRLWQEYCDAAKPIGELPGGVEEYDTDHMDSAAWELYQFALKLAQSETDAE